MRLPIFHGFDGKVNAVNEGNFLSQKGASTYFINVTVVERVEVRDNQNMVDQCR